MASQETELASYYHNRAVENLYGKSIIQLATENVKRIGIRLISNTDPRYLVGGAGAGLIASGLVDNDDVAFFIGCFLVGAAAPINFDRAMDRFSHFVDKNFNKV